MRKIESQGSNAAKNKILVLVENYPNNQGGVSLMYVHTRNLHYQKQGLDITVVSFRAKISYLQDGISVLSLDDYVKDDTVYDILLLHAANIKHHYLFVKKYGNRFKRFVFFYHGHEVLKINKVYSKPYPYLRVSLIKNLCQDIYDSFKLAMWRRYLPSVVEKSHFVFVSRWMYDEFLKWTKIPEMIVEGNSSITYNCVGKDFEEQRYIAANDKKYDFVTIRGHLDGSKYAVDIVNRLAYNTPDGKFLVIGTGKFFDWSEKAPNLEWRNETMSHAQIIEVLQQAKFALMPTRTDAQGLMMCEMAAFGIPVITSDIPVCHEVFDGFTNAYFIDNENSGLSLDSFLSRPVQSIKDTRFTLKNTVAEEIQLFDQLVDTDYKGAASNGSALVSE